MRKSTKCAAAAAISPKTISAFTSASAKPKTSSSSRSAGPANLEELDVFGFADAEVNAEIVLGEIAAAAAHFVDLRMQIFFAGEMRDAFDACADAAAIRFRTDGFDLDPIVAGA